MSADVASPVLGEAVTGQLLENVAEAPVTVSVNAGPDTVADGIAPPAEWASTPETVWNIDGAAADVVGGAGDRDTFVLGPTGSVAGLIDGGAGGFDTLVIAEQRVAITVFDATGPDSGLVTLDDRVVAYANLEPVVDNTVAPDKVFNAATGGADTIRIIETGANSILVDSVNATFEDHTVRQPTSLFTINAGAGDDIIRFDAVLFQNRFQIDGGTGNDTLDVSGRAVPTTVIRLSDGSAILSDGNSPDVIVRNVENFITGSNPTITANGIPNWIEQGPGRSNSIGRIVGYAPFGGAVNAIVAHPFDANTIYVGTVNGGVWRSIDAGQTWTPLTDQFPSLAISALALSTHDADGNAVTAATPRSKLVLYAGTGSFSGNGFTGGVAVGLMRSGDGGDTWELLPSQDMVGLPITGIAATRIGAQDIVLVSADAKTQQSRDGAGKLVTNVVRAGGIFRSTDGGLHFSKTELVPAPAKSGEFTFPPSSVTDIVADPGNLNRFYAAVIGGGVYQSDNAGQTWTPINNGLTLANDGIDNDGEGLADNAGEAAAGAGRIILAVRQDPASAVNTVHAALIDKTGYLLGIFRKAPADAAWSLVGTDPPPRREATSIDKQLSGNPNLTFAAGAVPTITRAPGGSWITDGFVANSRIVVRGSAGNDFDFIVTAVSATVLTLQAGSNVVAEGPVNNIKVYQLGESPIRNTGDVAVSFVPGANPTLTRPAATGDWRAEGFMVGQDITVAGSINNDGTYVIAAVNQTTITLQAGTILIAEAGSQGVSLTANSAIGPDRSTVQPQVHEGEQGDTHFSMNVDAAGNIYIGGDSHPDVHGLLYRWNNAAGPVGQVWESIAGGSAPHADSRAIVFDANGALLEGDDGGIYRLPALPASLARAVGNPTFTFVNAALDRITRSAGSWIADGFAVGQRFAVNGAGGADGSYTISALTANTLTISAGENFGAFGTSTTAAITSPVWQSLNSGLRAIEELSVAYDPLNNVVFGGTQDNGVSEQPSPGNGIDDDGDGFIDESDERLDWDEVVIGWRPGDGNTTAIAAINNDADPQFDQVVRYTMSNDIETLGTRVFGADGQMVPGSDKLVWMRASAADTLTINSINPANDRIRINNHGLATGAGPFWFDSTANVPGGVVINREYWAIRVNNNEIRLATSAANAAANIFVNITSAGTGTRTLTNRFAGLDPADTRTFRSGFREVPYEVNVVDPTRMLIGMRRIYASANIGTAAVPVYDGLDTVASIHAPAPTPGNSSFFSALAYGGRKAGANQVNVIYGARGNEIFVSLPNPDGTPGAFVRETKGLESATAIHDIVLDSENYEIAYAVSDNAVYKRIGADNWVVISQRLSNPNLATVEFLREGGHDVLLVGGVAGVFRAVDPAPGVRWTEFGAGLPNAAVRDVSFVSVTPAAWENPRNLSRDDLLLAGTQGRGAWTVNGADAFLGDAPVIIINGTAGDDQFSIRRTPTNPSLIDIFVGAARIYSVPITAVERIEINGLGGNDTLTLESAAGPLNLPRGIVFDGGDGTSDQLILEGSKVWDTSSDTTAGATTLTIEDTREGATQVVVYSNTETVTNSLAEASLLEKIGDALGRFFGFIDDVTVDPAIQPELALLGGSLPRALGGATGAARPALGDPKDAPDGILNDGAADGEEGESVEAEGASGGLGFRRLIEEGPAGFGLADIGSLITTPEELRQRLDALDGIDGNVTFTEVGGVTRFDMTIDTRLEGEANLDVATELFGGAIALKGGIDVGADVRLRLVFGVDADGFFVEVADSGIAIDNIVLDGAVEAAGRFGFLDVEVDDASVVLGAGVGLNLALKESSGDGRIRFDELASAITDPATLANFAAVTATGAPGDDLVFHANAKVAAVMPGDPESEGFDIGAAEVTFTWADITQPGAVTVSASAGPAQDLLQFLRVGPQQILAQLQQLQQFSASFNGVEVPFLQGTLDQLVDIVTTIDANFIQPLTSGFSGSASFGSLQELIRGIAGRTGVDPDELGLAYDSANKEVTWDLSFHKIFDLANALDLGIDLQTGFADLTFSTDAQVQAILDLAIQVGIDLDDLAANPSDPGRWVFFRDPHIGGSIQIDATNLDATARFGFLSVGVVDGSANANIGIQLSITDPGTVSADGRIDLAELAAALTGITPSITGSGNLSLPIDVPFLGINQDSDPATPPAPDTVLTIDWPQLTDPDTISVTIPTALEASLGRFTNMDAGTLVSLLAQITSWLSEFKNSDAFNIDVPFIGDAVRGVLNLSDLIQKTLLFDDGGDGVDANGDPTPNDVEKLVDKNNRATFTTVQELAEKLITILGAGDVVSWDQASESLIIDLSLASTFGSADVPLAFDFDLGALADLKTTGKLHLSADGELNLKLGIYLGNEGGIELSDSTLLSSLKGGAIVFNKDQVVAAPNDVKVTYGRLDDDAKFQLKVNGGEFIDVTVAKDATATNETVLDLAADINAALVTAGLGAQIQAQKDATSNRVVLRAIGGTTAFDFKALSGTAAVSQMGFQASQVAETVDGVLRVRAGNEVTGLLGRLSADANLAITLNTVNGGSPMSVTIASSVTAFNRSIIDVVNDVQDAINQFEIGGVQVLRDKIVVSSQGRRLLFTSKIDGTSDFSVTATGTAVSELGFAATNQGSGADIVVTTRDGSTYGVSFDALGPSATLGDVINAIETQTSGKVQVAYVDGNTRLRLTNDTGADTTVFKVTNAIGSIAASLLGILGQDVVDASDPDEVKDYRFDSGQLGGVDPFDRLFIQQANARVGFAVATPGDGPDDGTDPDGVDVTGRFGFVSVNLNGQGSFSGDISIGLKDPDPTNPDGRITLNELFNSLDDITALIDPPALTGGGELTFSVDVNPSLGLIQTGAEPTVKVQVLNLGDLFDARPDTINLVAAGGAPARTAVRTFTLTGDFTDRLLRGSDIVLTTAGGAVTTKIDTIAFAGGTTTVTVFDDIPAGAVSAATGATPLAPSVRVTTEHFDDLGSFQDIGFHDVLEALRALVDFLRGFEAFDFLDEPIPVINVSVNDMLAYADKFAAALDQIAEDPNGTVQFLEQKLKEAFHLPQDSDLLQLDLVREGTGDSITRILRFDLTFKPEFSESLPIGFELPTEGFELSGGADLHVQGALDLKLSFGIDLNDPSQIWIFKGTGIAGTLDAGAEGVDFAIGLGDPDGAFIGGRIIDGDLAIAGDFGFNVIGFTAGAGDEERLLLTDLLGNLDTKSQLEMNIIADGTLPVYFPTASLYRGNIEIGGALTADLDGLQLAGTKGPGGNEFIYVDPNILSFDFSQFSALDNLLLIIDGVDGFLAFIQDLLDGEVGGMKLPLIGDKLADAATFDRELPRRLHRRPAPRRRDRERPDQNFISQKLFDLLHTQLDILADRNGDGQVTIADIQLQTNVDEAGVAPANLFMQWNMKLGGTLLNAGTGHRFRHRHSGTRSGDPRRGQRRHRLGPRSRFRHRQGQGFYLDLSDPDELAPGARCHAAGRGSDRSPRLSSRSTPTTRATPGCTRPSPST